MRDITSNIKTFFTKTYNKDDSVPYAWYNTEYCVLTLEQKQKLYNNLSINKNISYETFKIPLIFIGVPLLWKVKKNYYTDYNILEVLETTSEILAKSLMKAIM